MKKLSSRLVGHDVVRHRDIRFRFDQQEAPEYWFGGDAWMTHLFNALLFVVPDGERWVMDSARKQLPKIQDPELVRVVRAFIRQEASHSREHDQVNALMMNYGIPADKMEAVFTRLRRRIQLSISDDMQAAVAAGIEHFTGVLAEVLFENPELFATMSPKMRSMVYWHLIEETEHKGVSFDIFSETVGRGVRAYLMRLTALAGTFVIGFPFVLGGQFYLLHRDGEIKDLGAAAGFIKMALFKPALLPRLTLSMLEYVRPSFHPWDHDNLHIVEIWHREFARTQDPIAATEHLFAWQMQQYGHDLPKKVLPVLDDSRQPLVVMRKAAA